MKYCKEVTQLVRKAKELGFEDEGLRNSGHIRLRHPNGYVTVAATPSSPSSMRNSLADLRRVARGVNVRG